ncbi:PAC2 family protein [Candidatus Tiddalikarchaeum anstoanum]|nr:PAC2 family protein [Candidatus Tiddalikarchaeum anstoanum]
MKSFEIEWVKKKSLKRGTVIKGVPGIGNISHICVDYIKTKLKAELVCNIYSPYLPNIVLVNKDCTVSLPSFQLYLKEVKGQKIILLLSNYQPKEQIHSYEFSENLVSFLKKEGVKEIITIAGIGLKDLPNKITLHIATADVKVQKKLKQYKELLFDGPKSVALIVGSAGLILGFAKKYNLSAFGILASTWAHPQHIGIKESKFVLQFLNNYLNIKLDFADLNNEIKKINEQIREITKEAEKVSTEERGNYIG